MDNLPQHVIDTIVSYTIGRDKLRPELRTDTSPLTVPHTLYPLMGICREWRRVASSFIGESAIIFTNSQDTDNQNYPEDTPSLGHIIAAGLEHHVRHLQLESTIKDIADGMAYSTIDSLLSLCKGKLKGVQTVSLHVSIAYEPGQQHFFMMGQPMADQQEQTNMEKEVTQNSRRIGELLKEAMPNIISVVYSYVCHSRFNNQPLDNAILSALLSAAPSAQYLSVLGGELSYTTLGSELAPNVKHMHVSLRNSGSNRIPELVIRFADRLETLTVDIQDGEQFSKLFKGPVDGSPVVYSKLRMLKVSGECYWRQEENSYTLQINPFPELRRLICRDVYPFRTSHVLRWIQPTVEVMEVNFRNYGYNQFVEDGVLDADSFPNLRRVNLSWHIGRDRISIADTAGQLPRVLSLSPVLKEVIFDTRVSSPTSAVVPLYRCRDLRELNLAGVQFTIADAIGLINIFPNLQSVVLSLKTSHDVNERGDVSDAEVKEFLEKHDRVANSQLRTLEISTVVFTTRPRAAQHILLLASIFKSIQGIKIRSFNERRDADILGALDEAKQRKCFDNDGEGRLQCMKVSLVEK
ncbi:hypothetical protein DL89DRAFT_285224 [Linderina pennispora]|uniref:F-box domain-containing protein n=1 Tax=Linderina pennispora TaxID=61395 RepID=A0A1Y1W2L5_9FUNG|nr:uncharacterized protein DL89DRAFT_285224 [Linderina pennispora]ORX67790.1 hypothetical protein DL89DRAFT_285224 [Linderina pennispora]